MYFVSWNKINPFITKYSQNQQFWNTLITASAIPYLYCDLWNNKADIVILSFINEWVLLVHWWQRQAAAEGSLRGDERAPDIPQAKPCSQPSEAARHFDVELWQHWHGGSYKAKSFPWCLVGTNISFTYFLEHTYSPSCRQGPYCSRWRRILHFHWYPSHYKRWHAMQPWLRRSSVNQTVHRWLTMSIPRSYDTSLYLNDLS